MLGLKYYEGIRRAQARPEPLGPGSTPDIDFDKPAGLFSRLLGAATGAAIRSALAVCRVVCPNPKIGRLVIVTRAADVMSTLKDGAAFEVPFALEMTELGGGANSVLGLEDEPHQALRGLIRQVIDDEADAARICRDTAEVAQALIRNASGRLDVMGDLITRCASESCARYFGLPLEDPVAFANWTMAVSTLLFADPTGSRETRRRGLYGAARLQALVDRALEAAEARHEAGHPADTLADRFVRARHTTHPDLAPATIRATLIGLMTGFVPTNTLAAGKMLEALLKRPDAWRQAREAARAGDRDRLKAILLEAGRLNPALFPGQFRYARTEGVIAEGTWRRRVAPKGSVVLVATGSALADGRAFPNPRAFDPDRPQRPELMFGWGHHSCLGAHLAPAQITEVFLALLALDDLRPAKGPAGRMRTGAAFPRRLEMEFTPPAGAPRREQSMVVVCAPLRSEADAEALKAEVCALGNPARGPLREALAATDRIHFCSLSVIDLGEPERPAHHLLLEINADGDPAGVLSLMAGAAHDWLAPLFAKARDPSGGLLETLRRYNLDDHARPWSMTHLNFCGTGEFAVADIARQAALADFARRALDHHLRGHASLGARPMQALRYVRRLINGETDTRFLQPATRAGVEALMEEGKQFRDLLIQPARRKLKIAEWTDISIPQARLRVALSRDARPIHLALLAGWAALTTAIFLAVGRFGLVHAPARLLLALTSGLAAEFALVAAGLGGLLLWLRAEERKDVPDTRHPDFEHLQACTANEDAPGYAQNHFIATPMLKKGLLRRLTLGAALWGIGTLVTYGFRPGFVLNMGTIHYAKWFRPPGSRRLVFVSNYDGSWESYLEDFITKAHAGQTAAWTNCEGFPPTRFLTGDGAKDGDRFKRWVRRQQVPSQFWFARFPELTTEHIRNNALIHHGLAKAHTDSAARAWLSCFGSAQRPESVIETGEIQSLMFGGFGRLRHGVCLAVRLPDPAVRRRAWLDDLLNAHGDPRLKRFAVTFGSAPGASDGLERATIVAFSAGGLARLGVPDGEAGDGLATFPAAFRAGMAGRARVLGDRGEDAPWLWRWTDSAAGAAPSADAAVLIYARTRKELEAAVADHIARLGAEAIIARVDTGPMHPRIHREAFGFRDGVSQPVIRGVERFQRDVAPADLVEPGEFILGYRSNQGYIPPSPVVAADTDRRGELPTAQAETPRRFPAFAEAPQTEAFRDFGRNGSYLVLRQFEQHVAEFRRFTHEAARRLEADYPGLGETVGTRIRPAWIAAKLVGRWRNGPSLIDRPRYSPSGHLPMDNDFAFGADDPQGLRCPLGAHVRRANPRDGLDPDDPRGRDIVNRHRLLRRGRSYRMRRPDGRAEHGMLFAAFCADLERQFEFIQQTWINAPSFHGLSGETDPLLGEAGRSYTIPTPAGAVRLHGLPRFVTVRGGGYFFMPSRSALAYLAARTAALARIEARAPHATQSPRARPNVEPGVEAGVEAV